MLYVVNLTIHLKHLFCFLPFCTTLIVTVLLDNGPHYHNSGVLFYLTEVNRTFNINLKEYNYFEAGEGKSQLHSHFAHISNKIVHWVRMGNDFESSEQVLDIIKVSSNLSMYMLQVKMQFM